MDRAKIIAKLRANRRSPEVFKELSNNELADLVVLVLSQVDVIEKAIREGRLDGYTPQPDKDYLSKGAALSFLTDAVNRAVSEFDGRMAMTGSALESQVQAAIQRIRDGKDGIVTEDEIARAAEIAASLIELPNFEELVAEQITRSGPEVRNSLELLQGNDRLSMEAISGLNERLEEMVRYASSLGGSGGTIGKQQVYSWIRQAVTDGTIPAGSSSSVTVETPSGSVNASNTSFTVTAEPKWVVADGVTYYDGAGYTYASLTVTMDVPPSQYIRAII